MSSCCFFTHKISTTNITNLVFLSTTTTSHTNFSFRHTTHQIPIVQEITSLSRPYYTLASTFMTVSSTAPPHTHTNSRSPHMYLYSLLISKNKSKLRWKLLQSEITLTSSLQSADLTATIVWVRFYYCYPTATNGMLQVDNCLPFCCKFTTNCNAKIAVGILPVGCGRLSAGSYVRHSLTAIYLSSVMGDTSEVLVGNAFLNSKYVSHKHLRATIH